MNRFKGRTMILSAMAIALAVVLGTSIAWLYSGGDDSQKTGFPRGGIALAAPALQGDAFRSDEAGFSAYLRVADLLRSQADLGKVLTVCTEFPAEIGVNHILCKVGGLSSVFVNLYADVNGWLVAYVDKDEPSSRAAQWRGDGNAPVFDKDDEDRPAAALDEAIRQAVEALGGDYEALKGNTGYYHWQLGGATTLTTLVKTSGTEVGGRYFFAVPATATLSEASIAGFGYNGRRVLLDDAEVLRTPCCGVALRGEQIICRETPPGGKPACPGPVALGQVHEVKNDPQVGSAFYLLWSGGGSGQ